MDANTQTIYEELKEVARSRQTLFYEDLSKLIDLPPRSRKLYEILDSINLNEYQEGRPLLSALAVRRGFRIPGAGFFIQAKKLGKYGDTSGDATAHATFWVDEVHHIWDYRKNHQTVKRKKGGVPNSAPKVEAWLSGLKHLTSSQVVSTAPTGSNPVVSTIFCPACPGELCCLEEDTTMPL